MIQLARVSAVVAGLLICTLLPYAPGRHDVLAVTVSSIAQVVGWAGVILVPVGALWLIHASRGRNAGPAANRIRHGYTLAVLVLVTIIGLLAALAAATQYSFVLGIGLASVSTALAWRAGRRSRLRMLGATGPDRITPLSCIVAPIVLLLLQRSLVAPVTEFARDRAIGNSAGLIADIERFRATRGHYPLSLHSVWEDYDPSVMGIDRYHYEPQGEAYNLFFEQPSFELGARVFVVFNPSDEQTMTSHDKDLLQLAPLDLQRQRGFFEARPAPQPHWKSFLFD